MPLDFFGFCTFARLDPILKDHLENGAINEKMTSWKIHNHVHNIWDFFMVDQTLLLAQSKRSVIICNKLVYKSCLTSCPPPKMEILSVLVKIS